MLVKPTGSVTWSPISRSGYGAPGSCNRPTSTSIRCVGSDFAIRWRPCADISPAPTRPAICGCWATILWYRTGKPGFQCDCLLFAARVAGVDQPSPSRCQHRDRRHRPGHPGIAGRPGRVFGSSGDRRARACHRRQRTQVGVKHVAANPTTALSACGQTGNRSTFTLALPRR